MRTNLALILAGGIFLCSTRPGQAEPILSFSSAADLNNLQAGQLLTIHVDLTGLTPGDRLDFLAATVTYDSKLLSPPTISAGAIVPDPQGFLKASAPGAADALYDSLLTLTGARITDNGTFFSFDVTVLDTGAGAFSFDFLASRGVSASGTPLGSAISTGPLTFTSTGEAIPEPPALLLGGMAFAACLAWHVVRRFGWAYWQKLSGQNRD